MNDVQRAEIAEMILRDMENKMGHPDNLCSRMEVEYTFGGKSVVPAWLVDQRGHNLAKDFNSCWPGIVTKKNVFKSFNRVRLVPSTLRIIMEKSVEI
jgi:hypothetical protein